MFFFFNDTATTEIYTLSLHDALPISRATNCSTGSARRCVALIASAFLTSKRAGLALTRVTSKASTISRTEKTSRSEEHTSELQSRQYLVCRLLLEKKKKKEIIDTQSL